MCWTALTNNNTLRRKPLLNKSGSEQRQRRIKQNYQSIWSNFWTLDIITADYIFFQLHAHAQHLPSKSHASPENKLINLKQFR